MRIACCLLRISPSRWVAAAAMVFVLAPLSCIAQRLVYKVEWRGDSVGYLEVKREMMDGSQAYLITSDVGFWMFGRHTISYTYESVYDSVGTLLHATTHYVRDGKLRETVAITKDEDRYTVKKDGREEDPLEYTGIHHSISKLYYSEPVGRSDVLSERWGKMVSVEQVEDHRYKLTKPGGRSNYYQFSNGICEEVVVDNFMATFYFRRVE